MDNVAMMWRLSCLLPQSIDIATLLTATKRQLHEDADYAREARGLAADRSTWHILPIDTLFILRKVSGTALLAARLKARVDIIGMASAYLAPLRTDRTD